MSGNRWAITLRSKYTGREQPLGATYATREEAQAAADTQCRRCNYTFLYPVPGEAIVNPIYELSKSR